MRLSLSVAIFAVLLVGIVVELVRRRRLTETFALLWIGVGLAVVALSVGRPVFDRVSRLLGVSYGTSLLFSGAIVFLLLVCMSLSMHVSSLRERVETLAEEVAFLRGVRGPEPSDPDAASQQGADDPPVEVE